jgi:phenylacetic acid degradation protein
MPARIRRELSAQEVAWKLEGTRTYQNLSLRSLASMVEVAPLSAQEAARPRLQAPDVRPLIATKRD